jgi:hypothetical protein
MGRTTATLLFLAFYVAGFALVAELNASYIIEDAVVGPPIIAAIYALFFSPSAAAAIVVLRRQKIGRATRALLTLAIAALPAIGIAVLFAAAQSERYAISMQRTGVGLGILVGMNLLFTAAFLIAGKRADRPSVESGKGRSTAV